MKLEFCRNEGAFVVCKKGVRLICEAGRPNIPGQTELVKPFLCRDEVRVCVAETLQEKRDCPNSNMKTADVDIYRY